ncbi:MAG: DJ-1/PfpI family protein [Selenomonadaceae bacterium]
MNIYVVLFPDFTALDFVGPVEALSRLDGVKVHYVSLNGGAVANAGGLSIMTEPFPDGETDVVLIPGGWGTRPLAKDAAFAERLKALVNGATWCLTVCTGSVLLARTGLIDGQKATSNKRSFDWVTSTAPSVDWKGEARWVVSGKYYTSSGVSAGIDMALGFIADQFGRDKALFAARGMEYVWNDDKETDPFAVK